MSVEIVNGNEPWLAHFEEEKYLSCPKGTVEHDLALIIKGMLLSDTGIDDAARTAAHQINAYYWARNLDSGPQFQYGIEDEPSYDFLSLLYSMIVRMAPFVSYSGNKQDKLVGLFLELHKVPRNPVKVWNGDHIANGPGRDELFVEILDETWNTNFPHPGDEQISSSSQWKERCDKWVNLSSFAARCIQADLDLCRFGITKYASLDIPAGLEVDMPPGVTRNSRVMIGAQYILLAGHALDREFIQTLDEDPLWGRSKWQLWAEKLRELAGKELTSEVKEAVIEARKKMISIHPELFYTSEGGSKPDG